MLASLILIIIGSQLPPVWASPEGDPSLVKEARVCVSIANYDGNDTNDWRFIVNSELVTVATPAAASLTVKNPHALGTAPKKPRDWMKIECGDVDDIMIYAQGTADLDAGRYAVKFEAFIKGAGWRSYAIAQDDAPKFIIGQGFSFLDSESKWDNSYRSSLLTRASIQLETRRVALKIKELRNAAARRSS